MASFEINVELKFDERTINQCCEILSMYLTSNPDRAIYVRELPDSKKPVRRDVQIIGKDLYTFMKGGD